MVSGLIKSAPLVKPTMPAQENEKAGLKKHAEDATDSAIHIVVPNERRAKGGQTPQ